MNRRLYFVLIVLFCLKVYSQGKSPWTAVNNLHQKNIETSDLESKLVFRLNEIDFKQSVSSLQGKSIDEKGIKISIPNSSGNLEQFIVKESSNFTPELQAKFPDIRSYSGTGITDPTASINFSISPSGIQTMILRGDSGSEFIEPYGNEKTLYVLLTSKNRNRGTLPLTCKTVDVILNKELLKKTSQLKVNNAVFKTMRLALSCTGEYTAYFGGTVAGAMAGMNATMTRVNGVFNKDLAVKLEIITDNNLVMYTNAVTDPYSDYHIEDPNDNIIDGSEGAWNLELQRTLSTVLGSAKYDIGHLFANSGGGGDAGCIGCVCVDPTTGDSYGKGSAYTSPADAKPEGNSFDIDYVAHEMGHQLGANHIFSYVVEGTGVSMELGSGSSVMGYAGITDYDVQSQSDDYFGYASILQIQDNLATKSCPVSTPLSNQTPTINAGLDYIIPISTAFVLKGTGSDPNGNTLTYCWEQNDSANSDQSGSNSLAYAAKPNGPLFRSFLPSSSPVRYMPALNKVLIGQLTTTWESVSSINRTLNFTLTARDNATLGLGQTNTDAMKVTVNTNAGPFEVTSQNIADRSWVPGAAQTITWSVNNTNTLAGSTNVNIKLSTDGGLTFPITLIANTPNDGSEVVTAPTTPAKNCRILIEPTGNIYYAVNSTPFSIGYLVTSSCESYVYVAPFAIAESQTYTERTIVVPAGISEIQDVNFNVGLTHSYLSDVEMEVVSPKGTVVKLFNRSCDAVNSSLLLKYDDLGGVISCGATILQTVAPYELLSAFNGENPQGTWTLRVRDAFTGDSGTIDTASIDICSKVFTLITPEQLVTDVTMYPNPNSGNFNVQFASSPDNGEVKIVIYDLSGKLIFKKEYENKLFFKENIQLQNVASGIYIMNISDDTRRDVTKIAIQ
jgi:subtilisin-like proprotein convertase family protein